MKRLLIFSGGVLGLGLAIGLLGASSYVGSELVAALVLVSLGFGVVFGLTVGSLLVHRVAKKTAVGLRSRAPQWNRARHDWMAEFGHSLQRRHLWQRWTHRNPTPAVPSIDAE